MKRIASAVILISLLLLLLYRGSVYHFWVLYLGVTVIALDEYYRLIAAADIPCFRWSGIVGGVVLSFFILRNGLDLAGVALAAVFVLIFLRAILSGGDFVSSLKGVAATFLGVFYIAYCLGHFYGLRGMRGGANLVLFGLVLLWANDTGAYYVGSRFGATKMAPTLSPGKTWEGFFGGFLLTLVAAGVAARLLPTGGLRAALVMVGVISVFGPVGDLAESMIKRASGQKDSGTIIPGHGGLLDRIDSLIFCAPFLYYYCRTHF